MAWTPPAVWHYAMDQRAVVLGIPSGRVLDNPELTPLAIRRAAREAIDTLCDERSQ